MISVSENILVEAVSFNKIRFVSYKDPHILLT